MRRLPVCAALCFVAWAGAAGQEAVAPPTRPDAPSSARREDASAEAGRLLSGLKLGASVYVYDREAECGYNGGYGYGCGGGRGRRALAALRDETARTYAGVLGRLAGAELLDPAEASGLRPDLTFKLYDERDRKTSPLPDRLDGVKILAAGGAADGGDDAPRPGARQ